MSRRFPEFPQTPRTSVQLFWHRRCHTCQTHPITHTSQCTQASQGGRAMVRDCPIKVNKKMTGTVQCIPHRFPFPMVGSDLSPKCPSGILDRWSTALCDPPVPTNEQMAASRQSSNLWGPSPLQVIPLRVAKARSWGCVGVPLPDAVSPLAPAMKRQDTVGGSGAKKILQKPGHGVGM